MADVKWIKICTDIFDDEKIILIESMPDAYAIITVWFKLLCLAGKQNNDGVFMMNNSFPYTDEMLATIFRMPLNTVRLALETFERFGMIAVINDVITIPNWGKHQSLDRIDKIRDYQRAYHREYRKKQALLAESTESKDDSKLYVNRLEEEKKENKKKNKKERVFTPPTLEEVTAYVNENGLNVDPQKFFNYFTVGNWVDSKGNPVKNWKQKLLTWASKGPASKKEIEAAQRQTSYANAVKDFMKNQ